MDLVKTAKDLAKKHLKGEDKADDSSVLAHVQRVVDIIEKKAKSNKDVLVAIAFLHDIQERAEVTRKDLKAEGFPEEVLDAVDAMTHLKDESYLDYLKRLKKNKLAVQVKLADLQDNIENTDKENRKDKYELALWFLTH